MKKILLGTLAIIACLAMIGCRKEKNTKTKNDKKSDNEIVEENTVESFKPEVLVSDDTRYVVRISKGADYTYFHEGEKITGFQIKMYYDNPTAAENAKKTLEEDRVKNLNIDSIAIDGNNLIIRYNSSMYDNQSLSTLKMVYEYVGELSD